MSINVYSQYDFFCVCVVLRLALARQILYPLAKPFFKFFFGTWSCYLCPVCQAGL
jgi:hypothetical protein